MIKKIFLTFLVSLFLVSITAASSLSEPSVCCEKTKLNSVGNGVATCINVEASKCDPLFSSAPTSCEITSFCKLGTCYDSSEGICMDNVSQTTCEDQGGTWDERDSSEIPQCQLGCCVIADQAAFVPLVRCKRMSSLFGVATDYRSNIFSEVECIATAQSQDMGACVYEQDFENVCKFTTRSDCNAEIEVEVANETVSTGKVFYKDTLCSAEELGTSCAKQSSTECYQGDVFWVDSCGNRENVYSSNLAKSWNNGKVLDADGVCNPSDGSDPDCGNCDYFKGARCGDANGLFSNKPEYGDFVCKKTECTDSKGNTRINGESWCVHPAVVSDKSDAVGSRYFKEVCVDGEVRVEACADYRNEICIEGSIDTSAGEFTSAACRVNRWQECLTQTDQDDCENQDRRDCKWMPSVTGLLINEGSQGSTGSSFSNPTSGAFTGNLIAPITGNALLGGDEEDKGGLSDTTTNREDGICVPSFAPGFNFWEQGDAGAICQQASARCLITMTKGLLDDTDWKVEEGAECLSENWALAVNKVCTSIGDCGGSVNYIGEYADEGYNWVGAKSKSDMPGVEKLEFSPSGRNTVKSSMTGFASAPSLIINDNLKLNAEGYVYVKKN